MGPDTEDNIPLLSASKRRREGKRASEGQRKGRRNKKGSWRVRQWGIRKARERRGKELHLLLWEILEMNQSAYLKLAPCVIVHSSVGLPLSQIPGLFVFTEAEGPQASRSPERIRESKWLLYFNLSFSHLLFSLIFPAFFPPFSCLLSSLAVLLGHGFNSFIPVTASLFHAFFSHPPSLLLHPLHAPSPPPSYRELSVFPIRIHSTVESAALHSQVSWGWFAIHSSGYGFTLTGIDKERKREAWKREAKQDRQ